MTAHRSEARLRVASNMRRLRQLRGWSQEELAAQCGLHRTFVSSTERGERNISVDNIDRMARALNVDVLELLTPVPETSGG
jgi:transcriptional regulator with XRE-family HTH domain